MSTKLNQPRQHHYVQSAHIRNFQSDAGKLTVYAKGGGVFVSSSGKVFKKRDLNTFETPHGLNTSFEDQISVYENHTFPAIARLAKIKTLNTSDLEPITNYLALSLIRNPTVQRGVVQTHYETAKATARILEAIGKIPPIPASFGEGKTLTSMIDDGLIQLDISNSVYLEHFVPMLEQCTNILMKSFRWSLLHSLQENVIISDHPLTFIIPGKEYGAYGIPLGGKGCEVAFPISKCLYLVGSWEKPFRNSYSEQAVRQLNLRQIIYANRHIASARSSEIVERQVKQYSQIGYQMRIDALPTEEGTAVVSRRGVYPLQDSVSKDWDNYMLGIKPIAAML